MPEDTGLLQSNVPEPTGRGPTRILILGTVGLVAMLCAGAAIVVMLMLTGAPHERRNPIAFVSTRDGDPDIYLMNADGSHVVQLTDDPGRDYVPTWSPDGSHIAFQSNRDGDVDIYLMDADGSNVVQLTDDPATDYGPAWSPDGTRIAFQSDRDGDTDIYVLGVECASLPEECVSSVVQLTDNPSIDVNPTWSPDGTRIAFVSTRDGGFDIYLIDAVCVGLPEGCGSNLVQLTDHPALDGKPAWSPDGTRIAFESDRNGNRDIYLMDAECASLPEGCGSNVVQLTDHPADDFHPTWSPDGSHIAFESERDGDTDIYVLGVECASLPEGCDSSLVQLTDHPADDRQPAWLRLIWL